MKDTEYQKAHNHLLSVSINAHPKIWSLVSNNGVIKIDYDTETDLFEFLARTAVGQQLSAIAARSIWNRIIELAEKNNISVSELFNKKNQVKLHKRGISKSKIKAILMLKEKFDCGEINPLLFKDIEYEELVKVITSLWGFGGWSADMVAIFYSKETDIWPASDTAVNRDFVKLINNGAQDSVEKYRPYRTYLARHIWRGIDSNII